MSSAGGATKKVAVRLVASGGRQVDAEFNKVGDSADKNFRQRLSAELALANKRMAAFARRARVASAAIAVGSAVAAGAMIRSGLESVDVHAKLAKSLQSSVAGVQTLERAGELAGVSMAGIEQATKDLTRRLSQAAAGGGPAAKALDRLGLSAAQLLSMPLDERVGAINAAIEEFVPVAERAAVAGQLFGEEGSIAMGRIDSATLRQATEDMRAFGVVVSDQDAAQIERTNDAISRLGLIWRGLSNQLAVAAAPALENIADALARMASVTGPVGQAIKLLIGNLDRLATYAATFVGFLLGRWVLGFAKAALSVKGLATGLVVLKGALVRTGIGALIVGAGELVYWFTKLVSNVGGFGDAMSLLKDLGVEVFERMNFFAGSLGASFRAAYQDLKGDAAGAMQSAIESVVGFGNSAANTFEGVILAAREIFPKLPAVVGEAAFGAANKMIDGIEAMLNGAIKRIDLFTGKIRDALAAVGIETSFGHIGEIDLGNIENPFAGAGAEAGKAASDAFKQAFEDNPLEVPDLGLGTIQADAIALGNIYRQAATDLSNGAKTPLETWQALKEAVAGAGEEGADSLAESKAAADQLADSLKKAGGAAKKTKEELTGWDAVSKGLADYAKEAGNWGKGLSDALVGGFQSAESAFRQLVTTGKLDFKSLIQSILADLAVLQFKTHVLGPLSQALTSGLSGIFAPVLHDGGMVGAAGTTRAVPATVFAGAPRYHSGGWPGLKPDEVPAILQRGERVLSRGEVAQGMGRGSSGTMALSVNVEGANGDRQIEEAVERGVTEGLRQYDKGLAGRVLEINSDPRYRK